MTSTDKVLIVDDDRNLLSGLRRHLRGFNLEVAEGGENALTAIRDQGPFAVVVTDMRMPGMDGLELLTTLDNDSPESVRIMLSGNADQETAVKALNKGRVFKYLVKPCPVEDLKRGIEEALDHYNLLQLEQRMLRETLQGSIQVMADILSVVDPSAFTRVKKISDWARPIGQRLGVKKAWQLRVAAILSHIGWVTVPHSIQEKFSVGKALEANEQSVIDEVPIVSADWISKIPRLEYVAETVRYQNKGFDGSGFPVDGKKGKDILLEARILKVLIDLCNLTPGQLPPSYAFEELNKNARLYDPDVFKVCQDVIELMRKESGGDSQAEVEHVSLAMLRPGQMLIENIITPAGHLILAKGQKVSETQIIKLKNYSRMQGVKEPISVLKNATAPGSAAA